MRKKQNQRSRKQDDVRQAEAVKPQADPNPQFEQLANDQRELERMLESMTDLEDTQNEELATAWQSITDRETNIQKQDHSLAESRSQIETEAETMRQKQQQLETLQSQLDARQQALEAGEAELASKTMIPSASNSAADPGTGTAAGSAAEGAATPSTSEQAQLISWEARLSSRERQLHERHALIDRQSRYAVLEKSNLRAQRDELAVWNEQLQNAEHRLQESNNEPQQDANEQHQLSTEWTELRSDQDDLQLNREDVERQRAEIDRHWLELETQIMRQHAQPDEDGRDESPNKPFSADPFDDSLDRQSPPDWPTDFADRDPASTEHSQNDLPLTVEDGFSENTVPPSTPISLNDLFGSNEAAAMDQNSETNPVDELPVPSETPLATADDQKPPVAMTDFSSSTASRNTTFKPDVVNNDDAPKTPDGNSETQDNQHSVGDTVDKPGSEELEEESIEAYMERLLSQSRSMADLVRRQTTQNSTVDPPASEKIVRSQEPDVAPQPTRAPATQPTMLTNTPVHEQDRDEVRAGLDSLRELANYSARSAIVSHTWRKHRTSILTKMSLVLLAFTMLSALSVFHILPYSQNLITRCALSGVGVAALYALLNPMQCLHTLRQDRNRSFHDRRP